MGVTVWKQFSELIPPLGEAELLGLEASLKRDGCRDALIVWKKDGKDVLLDGHNRYRICTKEKIAFETNAIELADENAAKLWIIDNQMGRRNLADIDRIALQARRKDIVAGMAKEKKVEDGKQTGRGHKKVSANLRPPLKTSKELARAAGVGERTFDAGVLVLKSGTKEDIEAVRRKEKSIHAVAKRIKEEQQREKRQAKRKEAAKNAPKEDERIIVGDFREEGNRIPDGSLNLILTDPPYDRKGTLMLPALGEFAAAKLADGGSLICYVGQVQIPDAIDALREHLRYWWTICCLHAGGATIMRELGIKAHWKAVLWFVKGTRDDKSVFFDDVISGGREKEGHDWQQAESEAAYCIEKLCPKDGKVCDPFLGSGTTAAAAQRLGREWIGFEIDPAAAATARKRVSV